MRSSNTQITIMCSLFRAVSSLNWTIELSISNFYHVPVLLLFLLLSSTIYCSSVQFSSMQCSAVQCSAVQCSAVWGNVGGVQFTEMSFLPKAELLPNVICHAYK